jgi:hypothetical protein
MTVRLKGYESQTADVTPDSDSRLQLTLMKATHASHRASRHVPATPPPPVTPTESRPAPVPNLHNGDVVDPFAPPVK